MEKHRHPGCDKLRAIPVFQAADNQDRAMNPLTPRQTEIVRLLALGRTVKEVAGDLGVAQNTVYYHLTSSQSQIKWAREKPSWSVRSIRDRLGFSDRVKLTHWAINNGLVRPGEV